MTEYEIERIKAEAKEQSSLAMCFATPTDQGLKNIGAGSEIIMRASFIAGATFALRLFQERTNN